MKKWLISSTLKFIKRNYSKLDEMNLFQTSVFVFPLLKKSPNMLITGYFEHGFVLNDTHLFGSLLLFPRNAFLWNCKNYKQIDVASLSLVHMMNPLPVIPFYSTFLGHVLNFKFHYFSSLLVGTGEEQKSLDPSIYKHFEEYGIAVETMSTVSFFF
jgi:uncharacterized protein